MKMRCLTCRPIHAAGDRAPEMVLICCGGSQYTAVCLKCKTRPVYLELGATPGEMEVFDTDAEFEAVHGKIREAGVTQ